MKMMGIIFQIKLLLKIILIKIKMKTFKLKRNFPGCQKGTFGIINKKGMVSFDSNLESHIPYEYTISFCEENPDWFEEKNYPDPPPKFKS